MTRATVTTMSPEGTREAALLNFYSAERRAGADPLTANERLAEFAKRLDLIFEQNLQAVRAEMGRS